MELNRSPNLPLRLNVTGIGHIDRLTQVSVRRRVAAYGPFGKTGISK